MARHGRAERDQVKDESSLANCHAFVSQEVVYTFQVLGIGATLRDETGWYAVHAPPISIAWFEGAHDVIVERHTYNNDGVTKARAAQKLVLDQHAGFHDFFVPVGPEGRAQAVLITGPIALERPTSAQIIERWQWMTGRQAHPADPEFSHYLSVTLDTLTFDAELLKTYERLLECYALLIAERGNALALITKANALRTKLERARSVEQMWGAARSMIDERTVARWLAPHVVGDFINLGIERVPEHALVGLTVGRSEELDPVDDLVRREGFQRACVELARANQAVCGKVGDHGVVFLLQGARSRAKLKATTERLADDAARLARRRFGLRLHFGSSDLSTRASLGVCYQQALRAAERALSEGPFIVHAEPREKRMQSPLRQLRRALGDTTGEKLATLPTRFERYIEAVGVHSGYRLEAAGTHLEAGFDQAAQALLSTGVLEERGFLERCEALERAARDASTMNELFAAYRRALVDLVNLAQSPTQATRDRSLGRAIDYIHAHFVEPLSVPQVASVAGFAPNYFAQLFKQREKMTFDQYVRRIRVERAQQLLKSTDLSAERVGQLSGFALRPYFYRVFKQAVGMTPHEYRIQSNSP